MITAEAIHRSPIQLTPLFPRSSKRGEDGNARPDASCAPSSSEEDGDRGWSWADGGTNHNTATPDGMPMCVQFEMLPAGHG